MRRLMIMHALAFVVAFAVAGCDAMPVEAPPPATCTSIGARCQLADGPVGVCQDAPCAPGATPPCFQCTPQH